MESKTNPAFSIDNVFTKYDQGKKGFLTKLELKCAFIFMSGMKPTKDDMGVIKQFV